ncbi:NYN domain-containing protein [Luteolibacter flavescens]|uniref:NYN domain-containing protein n=1 Tax=Luteolibacter flavescens TaxID=1859460 RepID=A0ABT3FU18_9BACT|nr:NYN domain-containing protein [Luteolibacter flavescens]MCW1887081.1 NYN domain-containing protein [Luteolibacter flavescens]
MPEAPSVTKPLAVLIDADNAQAAVIAAVLTEIAAYGTASVKRIYGNWTSDQLKGWKGPLLEHSIQPIQQFSYTTGKNATDSAMIIDAMDLLYTGRFSGFCLVTSDSDFTRLAARIREQGLLVLGFGEKKTPKPFVAACDKFIYTEVLQTASDTAAGNEVKSKKTGAELGKDRKLVQQILTAIDSATGEESEWASLGLVGTHLSKLMPDFDSRNYGYGKLSELLEAIGSFELSRKDKHVLIRRKSKGG